MKCTWQDGGKYCEGGKIAYAPCSEDGGPLVTENVCPACNGTGGRDLTADEAAEYMDANGQHGIGPIYFPKATEPGKKYGLGWEGKMIYADTIDQLFAAAARAIKERGKE